MQGQGQHEVGSSLEGSPRGHAGAGTQAPPVDTSLTKAGTPRKRAPKGTGFDRKAYQREKARERRAKAKADGP